MARIEEPARGIFSLIKHTELIGMQEVPEFDRAHGFSEADNYDEYFGEEEISTIEAIRKALKPGPAALAALDEEEYFTQALIPTLNALGFTTKLHNNSYRLYPISGPYRSKPLACFTFAPYADDIDREHVGKLHKELRDSGLKWGVATNLKIWRLYNLSLKPFHSCYEEVHLTDALKKGREPKLKTFLSLFTLNQMRPINRSPLDALLRSAQTARAKLLKDFVAGAKQSAIEIGDSPEEVIRILLIKWAEDVGVLPLKDNRIYRERYSFSRLLKEISDRLAKDFQFSQTSRRYHQGLMAAWDTLDKGHPSLTGIPGSSLKPAGRLAELPDQKLIPDINFAPAVNTLLHRPALFADPDSASQSYYPIALFGPELLWAVANQAAPVEQKDPNNIDMIRPSRWLAERHLHPDLKMGRELVENVLQHSLLEDNPYECRVLHLGLGFGEVVVATLEALAESAADQGMAPYKNAAHAVAERCIYGIDLDSYSVNITTAALNMVASIPDTPLPAPAHRLIRGNPLSGARLKDLTSPGLFGGQKRRGRKRPKQASLFEFAFAQTVGDLLTDFDLMDKVPDENRMDGEDRTRIIERLKKSSERYIAVANVWGAARLGLNVPQLEYMELIDMVDAPGRKWREIAGREWFIRANEIAHARGFIHWELFFPEIFFSGKAVKANPGFDAIMGWLPASNAPEILRLSLELLKEGGRAGFYLTKQSFQTLDEVLLERAVDICPVSGRRGYRAIFENMRND